MYKALKDNKIIAISDTDAEFPCLVCDAIASDPEHTTSDYVEVGGEYVLVTDAKAIEKKKDDVRRVRNSYLEKYVDPKQLLLVWESLSSEDKKDYADYRTYLLDYTKEENWWEHNPLTFDEWKFFSAKPSNVIESEVDEDAMRKEKEVI